MKKVIRTMSATLAMLAVVCITLTAFTACSDDDDKVTEVIYSMGFSQMSSSGLDFIQEMNTIESAFKTALGVTDAHFSMTGTNEECDKAVREACEKAYATLKDKTWGGSYTFLVTNVLTGEVVFETTFQANDENII